MASSDPMDTLHKIRTGQYSVITLLDMLEFLDVRDTIKEDQVWQQEVAKNKTGNAR